jgi:hypothetical protein
MYKLILTAAASCLLATTSFAQGANYYIPDNSPTTGTCNVIPFGLGGATTSATWSNQVYQQNLTNAQLGNSAVLEICDLAFSPCATGIKHFDTIEVVLGQSTTATLSTTFSANLMTNVKTVLKAKNYDWYRNAGMWDRIGFDDTYLYIKGTHPFLVIQITLTGARALTTSYGSGNHRQGPNRRVYKFGWTGTPPTTGSNGIGALKINVVCRKPDLHRYGHGCKGSNGKTPALGFTGSAALGATMSIDVTDCLANALSLHVIGLMRFGAGIDLGLAGAPGCLLYETTDIVIPKVASATGAYQLKFTVPKDRTLVCLRIYTQAFPADAAANRFGMTTSNYGRILPGF